MRLCWLLWTATVVLFFAVWLYPVSDNTTRTIGLILVPLILISFVGLVWKMRLVCILFLAVTVAIGLFMILPAHTHWDLAALRSDYVAGLCRYSGVRYYWGGESPKGIDCSGLMRRGMIDALFLRGIRSADPGLVRYSIWVWWHDCTAADFGNDRSLTARCFTVPSINLLDHSPMLPGDLAVTTSGAHIMAYLGSNTWIAADPDVGRVITEQAASTRNRWFLTPMNIVRWNILAK